MLNVGAWLRGVPGDYDVWAERGATRWDGAEAVRTYPRVEDTERGSSQWRGPGGPMKLSELPSPDTPLR